MTYTNDFGFLLTHLPPAPARLLEVGCGDGMLARALASSGYQVTAIDPHAPRGSIFRRVTIENFREPGPFDAVLAVTSLHHIEDLHGALANVRRLLRPGGIFVVEEFAVDRFVDNATAKWYYYQRQASTAVGRSERQLPGTYQGWRRDWIDSHRELHSSSEMRIALRHGFRQRFFSWTTYLYAYDLDASLKVLEEKLIKQRAIKATGFRWVGECILQPGQGRAEYASADRRLSRQRPGAH